MTLRSTTSPLSRMSASAGSVPAGNHRSFGHGHPRHQDPQQRARQRECQRLHQQLSCEPSACCAQRGKNCEFTLTRGSSSQQENGNVRASHGEQHQHRQQTQNDGLLKITFRFVRQSAEREVISGGMFGIRVFMNAISCA